MKKLLALAALGLGIGTFATTDTAQAGHYDRCSPHRSPYRSAYSGFYGGSRFGHGHYGHGHYGIGRGHSPYRDFGFGRGYGRGYDCHRGDFRRHGFRNRGGRFHLSFGLFR